MPAGVLPLSERLRSDFRFLRSLSASQVVIGMLALPLAVTLPPFETAVFILAILAYSASKIYRLKRSDHALKQVRLEDRFFRQHLDESMLKDCLNRSEHLWDESHILRALRGVQTIALPYLLSQREKIRLVQRKYHATFRALVPSRLNPEAIVPVLGLVFVIVTGLRGGSFWMNLFLVGVLAALIMEVLHYLRVLRIRRRIDSFERALSAWTLTQTFLFKTEPAVARPYRHLLLYRTEPVFNIRRAIHLGKARF